MTYFRVGLLLLLLLLVVVVVVLRYNTNSCFVNYDLKFLPS